MLSSYLAFDQLYNIQIVDTVAKSFYKMIDMGLGIFHKEGNFKYDQPLSKSACKPSKKSILKSSLKNGK